MTVANLSSPSVGCFRLADSGIWRWALSQGSVHGVYRAGPLGLPGCDVRGSFGSLNGIILQGTREGSTELVEACCRGR